MDSRFASKAKDVADVPEPFRERLKEHLRPEEEADLLVCAPAFVSSKEKCPATVLAVTDQRWLIATEVQPGRADVASAEFGETLLVEFTEILLYGELKIHHALDGSPHSSAAYFNTVMDEYYREATQLALDRMEGEFPAQGKETSIPEAASLSNLPFKFRNAVVENVPEGRQIVFTMHWPTLLGGFRRELAPAAVLALTQRELMLITEDKRRRWFASKKKPRYANLATYIPLGRIARHRISRHPKFGLLKLETHVDHGGEVFEIMFPLDREAQVAECMERSASLVAAAQGQENKMEPATCGASTGS